MKTRPKLFIMVFGVVTSDGDVMPQLIFLPGLKHNTKPIIKWFEEVVLTFIIKVGVLVV